MKVQRCRAPTTYSLVKLINNKDISWRAKAIAIAIALDQDTFADPTVPEKRQILIDMGKEGSQSIRAGMRELRNHGILKQLRMPGYYKGGNWSWRCHLKLN
jgi:hypothetical protein